MDGTWENAAHQSSLGNIIIADRDTQQSINRNGHGNQEKEKKRSSWSAKVEPKAEAVALQTICVVIIWSVISPGDVFSIQKSVIVVMGEWSCCGYQRPPIQQNGTRVISRNSTTHFHQSILTQSQLGCYLSNSMGTRKGQEHRYHCVFIELEEQIIQSNGLNFKWEIMETSSMALQLLLWSSSVLTKRRGNH